MKVQENKYEEILKKIESRIKETGMKQYVVAEKAGFTPNEMSAILNGRKLLRVEHISLIANALGVEPNDLYGIGKEDDSTKK